MTTLQQDAHTAWVARDVRARLVARQMSVARLDQAMADWGWPGADPVNPVAALNALLLGRRNLVEDEHLALAVALGFPADFYNPQPPNRLRALRARLTKRGTI